MFEERIQELTSYKESLARKIEECRGTLSSLQQEMIACDAILQEYAKINEKSNTEHESNDSDEDAEVTK